MVVRSEKDTARADQLRNNNALSTVDNKGAALSHPWIVAEVDFLLFDFTGYFVSEFNDCLEWSVKTNIVFAGIDFGGLWILEMVILESKFELLPGVILNRVNLGKNFTKTSLDKLFPRVELVTNKVWKLKRSLLVAKVDALCSSRSFGHKTVTPRSKLNCFVR